MTTDLSTQQDAAMLERVVVGNDLSRLEPRERLTYYTKLCESLGLNPLTRPFQYITLSGRLTLYATKDATEQLRRRYGVSVYRLDNHRVEDVYVVTAYARDKDGREDTATGAVPLKGLTGEALANGLMKAETKAKRRVTLSLCGLGMLDETEVGSIPDAKVVPVDPTTGEIAPGVSAAVKSALGLPTAADAPTVREAAEELLPDAWKPAAKARPVTKPEGDPLRGAAERSEQGKNFMELVSEHEQRELLLGQIQGAADKRKLDAPARRELWSKHVGGATKDNADLAALADLLAAIRGA